MQVPLTHGEGLQVLHYQVGELYQVRLSSCLRSQLGATHSRLTKLTRRLTLITSTTQSMFRMVASGWLPC